MSLFRLLWLAAAPADLATLLSDATIAGLTLEL